VNGSPKTILRSKKRGISKGTCQYINLQLTSPARLATRTRASAAATVAAASIATSAATATAAITGVASAVVAPVVSVTASRLSFGSRHKVSILVESTDCIASTGLGDVIDCVVGQDKGLKIATVFVLGDDEVVDRFVKGGFGENLVCFMLD
jgi:hypothetical protein